MTVLAEITLVVVLETDASRMRPGSVLRRHSLALRLLVVGMPPVMPGVDASARCCTRSFRW